MQTTLLIKLTPPEEGAKTVRTLFTPPANVNFLVKGIGGELPQNTFLIVSKANKVVFETISKFMNQEDKFWKTNILVTPTEPLIFELSSPSKFKGEGVIELTVEELR